MLTLNKKIIITILSIIFMLLPILTFAIVNPTSEFYVNDYANILSNETESYIIKVNESLFSQTGSQVVVVTVRNLGENSIEEYATELFRTYGIGDKNKDNGLLILLALEERKIRVEVGYGLEGILPDAKTGRIQDEYIIPYLKNNNWDEGIKNGFNAFINIISKEYNVEVGADEVEDTANSGFLNSPIFPLVFIGTPILGNIIGKKLKNLEKNQKITVSAIYIIITTIIMILLFKEFALIFIFSVLNILGLFSGMSSSSGGRGGPPYDRYNDRWNDNNFSGGSLGGGGSSGGGGSTRSF